LKPAPQVRRKRRGRPPDKFRQFQQRNPEAGFWVTAGLSPRAARALAKAGLLSLTDLEGMPREEISSLPGIGPSTLESLEELLDRPLAQEAKGAVARLPRRPRPLWPEEVWRKRGLPWAAAITFEQVGMTLERLRSTSREDLLELPGVGPRAVAACGLMIGKEIRSTRFDPVAAFWRSRGIRPKPARALSRGGLASSADLQNRTREDLLSLPGIGEDTIQRLEALLGSEIPGRTAYWLSRGLIPAIANVLAREGINSLDELGKLSRVQFLAIPGFGLYALRQCEKLLGRQLPSQRKEPK